MMYRILIMLISVLLWNCSSDQSSQRLQISAEEDQEPPRTTQPEDNNGFDMDKRTKIIRHGSLSLEAAKLEDAKKRIDSALVLLDGYYELENLKSYEDRSSYHLRLRVPNSNFDDLIRLIENSKDKVKSKKIDAKDVTEEYVDISLRLENSLAYLKQYQVILKKANSIKEILEVQGKIRHIEEEIESRKGRLKFLDDKINYSTLTVSLNEVIVDDMSERTNYARRVLNAFITGSKGIMEVFIITISLWPLLLIVLLVFLFRKKILFVKN